MTLEFFKLFSAGRDSRFQRVNRSSSSETVQ